jgi:hypothetical protein
MPTPALMLHVDLLCASLSAYTSIVKLTSTAGYKTKNCAHSHRVKLLH